MIICEILNILEGYPICDLGLRLGGDDALMVEAMRHAYVDRNTALGDPDFVDNPVAKLIDKAYAEEIRGDRPLPRRQSADLKPGARRVPPRRRTTRSSTTATRRRHLHAQRLVRGRKGGARAPASC